MTLEIRTKALEIAASIHHDYEVAVTAAERFATFLLGNDPAPTTAKPRGRPAKGESNGVALPSPEQLAAAVSTATSAAAASTAQTALAATSAGANAQADKPVLVQPTLQQVADAIIDLANNHSRDKAVAILTKYGVKKVPELKPENFVAVLADVATAKAPSAADSLV